MEPPPIAVEMRHYAGGSVGGIGPSGSAESLESDPAAACALNCEILYLEYPPYEEATPVGSWARLIVALRGDEPVNPSTNPISGASIWTGEGNFRALTDAGAFGRAQLVERFTTALPPSATVSFEGAQRDRLDEQTGLLLRQEVHFEISRSASGELEPALVIEGFVKPRSEEETTEQPAGEEPSPPPEAPDRTLERDCVILDRELVPGGPPLVVLFRPQGKRNGGLAAVVTASPAPVDGEAGQEHAENLQAFLQGAREMETAASGRASYVQRAESRARELASALQSLQDAPNRRAALVFLASATGADLAGDLALEADDALLLEWGDAILVASEETIERLLAGESQSQDKPLGWLLERSACSLLSARMAEAPLPSELAGLLVRHAGEVSRSGAAIDDIVRASKNTEDFRARLIEENRIFLEDGSPGPRVRAFDWLAARGLAPPGFDPLSPLEERARVLAELEAAAEAAPASSQATPR